MQYEIAKTLYRKISDARETVAGCNVKKDNDVRVYINDALFYAVDNKADEWIVSNLRTALVMMDKAKTYLERLPIDDLLCDTLNKMGDY